MWYELSLSHSEEELKEELKLVLCSMKLAAFLFSSLFIQRDYKQMGKVEIVPTD
jgi:hypothetical protein